MKVEINYSKRAKKFLQKNTVINKKQILELIIPCLRKVFYNENTNVDFKKLKGNYKNQYRIRKGDIRIIYKIENNNIIIVSIISIGYRGDIYKT